MTLLNIGVMQKNSFHLSRLVMRMLGVNIYGNESMPYKVYSTFMIVMAGLYPWSSLYTLLCNKDDFDTLINCLFNIVGGYVAFIKILVILYKKKPLELLIEKLEYLQKKRKLEWVKKEVYSVNKKVLLFIFMLHSCLVYFYGNTMWERLNDDNPLHWKTPIYQFSVLNVSYSPNYEIGWLYQSFAVTVVSSTCCIGGVLVAGIIMDLTMQLKILRIDIKQIKLNAEEDEKKRSSEYLKNIVKSIVVRHLELLSLIDQYETISNILILTDVVGNVCMISFSLYYASVLPPLDFKAVQSYAEALMVILALFLACYCGTEISLANQSVADACYEMDFIGTDHKFQKNLQMIILRCQRPIKLTVGKFTQLSIPVFVWIVRSSYTYLMVLRKSKDYNKP